ncbi:PilX N-terminal domain-containing pilus assembly protein [Thermosediminibacter oceani]|uniref:Type 4 fimbrial biogenesis protein PilX N-terminal domain-containing protein n=1 Tax=Thermosediminibacter oceani (strain ATCC BAA-1034 / DSM 16646 / JW/IW-1228P) TaxID=555079 RepID=D9S0L1_THEOJ|nr:PilX N-terminal domain-containing pilus assembly protein [Thermosediminibacter oceani]ADL08869.1 hypothetical protein Toce_2156 [Thermosediminibacter oceani DSM 16646]
MSNKDLPKGGRQAGLVLITVVFVVSVLSLLGVAILEMMTAELKKAAYFKESAKAYYLAEAGIHKTLTALKKDPDHRPNGAESLGDGSFEVSVEEISPGRLKVTSQGAAGRAKEKLTVTVEVVAGKEEINLKVISWKQEGKEEL